MLYLLMTTKFLGICFQDDYERIGFVKTYRLQVRGVTYYNFQITLILIVGIHPW